MRTVVRALSLLVLLAVGCGPDAEAQKKKPKPAADAGAKKVDAAPPGSGSHSADAPPRGYR